MTEARQMDAGALIMTIASREWRQQLLTIRGCGWSAAGDARIRQSIPTSALFFSSRDFADTSNRVASLERAPKVFKKKLGVDAQAVHTWTRQNAVTGFDCLSFPDFTRGVGSQQGMLYGLTRRTPAGILPSPPTTTTSRQIFALSWDSSIASTSAEQRVRRIFLAAGQEQDHRFWTAVSETVDWNHAGILQDWGVGLRFSG